MALTGTARRLGITTKTKHLRGVDLVTVREPDAITALLTTIGAPDTAATWARERTHHHEHTPTPRLPGFDDANHTRATHAAAAAATRAERALLILGEAPEHLAAVAALRSTHREVSLQALGQMLNPPMTKDAVAGRIRRLLALADNTARRTGIPDTTTALPPPCSTNPDTDTATCPGRLFEKPPPSRTMTASAGCRARPEPCRPMATPRWAGASFTPSPTSSTRRPCSAAHLLAATGRRECACPTQVSGSASAALEPEPYRCRTARALRRPPPADSAPRVGIPLPGNRSPGLNGLWWCGV